MKTNRLLFMVFASLAVLVFTSCNDKEDDNGGKETGTFSGDFEIEDDRTASWKFEDGALSVYRFAPIMGFEKGEMVTHYADMIDYYSESPPWMYNENFRHQEYITSISILGFRRIGDHAFSGCKAAKTIELSSQLEKIGDGAFSGCESVTSIVFPEKLREIDPSSFSGCTALSLITFPASLQRIGEMAFSNTSLTKVEIPVAVEAIGENAFSMCDNLTEVHVHWENPPKTYDMFGRFDETDHNRVTLYVPAGTKARYQNTEPWSRFSKIIEE